ncbi:alpha/beta hydrolase family protein [Bradyrhizobium macuxiense]|uniref:Alpha/beta hydrolase family protein n=1 Tax=Bradyrhizobium macuxiense TaxID=1755647 RepID=A0A560L043_9BRAD|nr:alpha/beta fold hydrolase [Bradyrhizobium macuxiense]TWB87744.1 alpha/beta hydrolase family protein [Bradyrhizobium macuxiense]
MALSAALPPTFVLVHGAYHGGWCWKPLARLLRAAGHEVYTPTQTGLGERRHLMSDKITMETFVLDIVNLILSEDLNDVVLVGHSYGGRSNSGVADRIPERLRRLIYIDGGLAPDGRSFFDALPEEMQKTFTKTSFDFDGGISLPPPCATVFGVQDPEQVAWLNRFLTPQPLSVNRSTLPLVNPLANGLPVTYVECVSPRLPFAASSVGYARKQPDWRVLEFNGGHNAIVTHAKEMAELLLREGAIARPASSDAAE